MSHGAHNRHTYLDNVRIPYLDVYLLVFNVYSTPTPHKKNSRNPSSTTTVFFHFSCKILISSFLVPKNRQFWTPNFDPKYLHRFWWYQSDTYRRYTYRIGLGKQTNFLTYRARVARTGQFFDFFHFFFKLTPSTLWLFSAEISAVWPKKIFGRNFSIKAQFTPNLKEIGQKLMEVHQSPYYFT